MSVGLNRLELIGRLGRDPDLRFTADGQPMTRFSVATDRPAAPGVTAETDWHSVPCWGKLAEFSGQHLVKGRLVYVAGRLSYRAYETKDGQRRRAVEVTATEIIALDRRPETERSAADAPSDDAPPF